MGEIVNVDMARAWDGDEGADWARDHEFYDRGVWAYQRRLAEIAAVARSERVLDIGCGNGESTRHAARAASEGSATGIDLSNEMLGVARRLAQKEGVANVEFVHGDAQVYGFEPSSYDVVLSRFGAMFFADRAAAARNLGTALRPGGRLVLFTWQPIEANEWLREIRGAFAAGRALPSPPVGLPGPFGLADRDGVHAVLGAAGYCDIAIDALSERMWFGDDADHAYGYVSTMGIARGLLHDLDDESRAAALKALHATLVAHETPDGVQFDSAAWCITARRPE